LHPSHPGAVRRIEYGYDDLDRLAEAVRGVDGGSPSIGSQRWTLDMLGNWPSFETDTDGDGEFDETAKNPRQPVS